LGVCAHLHEGDVEAHQHIQQVSQTPGSLSGKSTMTLLPVWSRAATVRW
jgi:hypothetical protein